ncbi:MAG: 2,3-bisphosphoglycerate-independent phosphoglycerate mutase [Deltaproteobacteria bacterium]|nr:2,3-bisphosphoglycerate-independent phosphoglycerate mutase [Deltaproteobacteria bacterium]
MRPVCLIVMDGWGVGPSRDGNAIALARTPNLDVLFSRYPHTTLDASGLSVGLPEGQMGNSEVGHLTLGAGRVIFQELARINKAIDDGAFFEDALLNSTFDAVKKGRASLHLMGLVSDGGVHSHMKHLYGLIELAGRKGLDQVFVHAFLDGRDTPPMSAKGYIEGLCAFLDKMGIGKVATISGRFYAMDRDKRWDRVERAYLLLTEGKGIKAKSALQAVMSAYDRGETDEFVQPTLIIEDGLPCAVIKDNDAVVFFNFRADRAREMTDVFTNLDFDGFKRSVLPRLGAFVCMTEYDRRFNLPVVFGSQSLKNILAEVLSKNSMRQFRISETEKYAHVTFFFNGGVEEPFDGEDRQIIPSVRDVLTYDKKPEMRAFEIAEAAILRIKGGGGYGFILLNFANGDMVGHTGDIEAAIKACEAVDTALGRVVGEAVQRGYSVIITSDHGNVEQMTDTMTGGPHTAHTLNRVPFILVDDEYAGVSLRQDGGLKDVAPTVLKLMGIKKPGQMQGESLV